MVMIYMGMNRILFVMWMAGILLLSSCSVKEDRSGCPCWMTVDLSKVAESRWKSPERQSSTEYQMVTKSLESRQHIAESVVLRLRGNSDEDEVDYAFKMTETVNTEVGALEYEVPRGSVGVSVIGMPDRVGHDGIAGYDGDEIRIPVGEQMDSLYGFFRMFYTRCESVLCDVELHKEFCTVSFTLGDDGYISPYDLEVWGNVAGVSPWDLMPLEGDFRFAPSQEDGVYRVRVPRQVDNLLELVMLEIPRQARNDNKEMPDQAGHDGRSPVGAGDDGERTVVDRLPLGEYIARSGYDWTAEDLADVNVALDLVMQQVMITVSGWDGVVVMDIVM